MEFVYPLFLCLFCCHSLLVMNFLWQVYDDNVSENPFSNFRVGETVSARIVGKTNQSAGDKRSCQFDLSLKPSLVTGSIIFLILFKVLSYTLSVSMFVLFFLFIFVFFFYIYFLFFGLKVFHQGY